MCVCMCVCVHTFPNMNFPTHDTTMQYNHKTWKHVFKRFMFLITQQKIWEIRGVG